MLLVDRSEEVLTDGYEIVVIEQGDNQILSCPLPEINRRWLNSGLGALGCCRWFIRR